MSGSLAALYRDNNLDDFDLDSLAGRIDMIRGLCPLMRRMTENKDGDILFGGPDGVEILVRIERGQLEFRFDRNAGGRYVRSYVSTPRDDDLLRRISEEGPEAWLSMMDELMSSPRGEVHTRHKSSMSRHVDAGLSAFEANQEVVELAARTLAVHNPTHRRGMSVILKPPGAGHRGSVRDDKGKPILSATVEKSLMTLCSPVANVSRTNWCHTIETVVHDVRLEERHADPIELLRLMSRHEMRPFEGQILTKAGAATR